MLPSQIFDNKDYEGGRARSLSKNPNSFSERLKAAQRKSNKNSIASKSPERPDHELLNSMYTSSKAQRKQEKQEREKS